VGRNGAVFLNAAGCKEASHGVGVQDIAEFDSDWCSVFCLLGERQKKKKKKWERERNSLVFFFQGQTCLPGCVTWDFHDCAIKGWFKG
jgi:hypothetical protein